MTKIFISGSMAYDDIMVFPHHFKDYFHPEKLHQINVSFAVSELAKHLGGIATNVSYALRNTCDYYVQNPKSQTLNPKQTPNSKSKINQDGNISIYPVGAVGRDGDLLLDFFKKNSIDSSYVLKDEKLYTATGKVITDMNDNQIWGFYYGACCINPKLETLKTKQMDQNSKSQKEDQFWIVSATHEKPFTTVLRHVIQNKLPYMFDPGMALTWIRDDLLKKGVLNATYVVGNDYEIAMIEKRLKMSVVEIVKGGVNVITTLGEKGVKYDEVLNEEMKKYPNEKINISHKTHAVVKAVRVRKVVDPTGAGDAWRGGFVGALVAGKSIRECLVMGNVMSSFAVQAMGTVEYKAERKEIEKRIKTLNPKQ